MKRFYFFAFISFFANTFFLNSIDNIEKKEKREALKQEILNEFDSKFAFIIGINSLSGLGYKNALLLKNLCHEYLKGYCNKFPSVKDVQSILQKEAAFCIATFARVKSSYAYKQQTTRSVVDHFMGSGKPIYNKNTKHEIGKKAYQQALNQFKQPTSGILFCLINESINDAVFAKTRELCASRLLLLGRKGCRGIL